MVDGDVFRQNLVQDNVAPLWEALRGLTPREPEPSFVSHVHGADGREPDMNVSSDVSAKVDPPARLGAAFRQNRSLIGAFNGACLEALLWLWGGYGFGLLLDADPEVAADQPASPTARSRVGGIDRTQGGVRPAARRTPQLGSW